MNTEPALIVGAIQAGITLAIAFGAPIDEGQKAAILGFAGAVLALVGAVVIRQNVTPTK